MGRHALIDRQSVDSCTSAALQQQRQQPPVASAIRTPASQRPNRYTRPAATVAQRTTRFHRQRDSNARDPAQQSQPQTPTTADSSRTANANGYTTGSATATLPALITPSAQPKQSNNSGPTHNTDSTAAMTTTPAQSVLHPWQRPAGLQQRLCQRRRRRLGQRFRQRLQYRLSQRQ